MNFIEKNPLNTNNYQPKQKIFTKLLKNKKIIYICLIVIVLILLGSTIYSRYFAAGSGNTSSALKKLFSGKVTDDKSPSQQEEKALSQLDGISYNKSDANRHPLAVMIENHTDARPQSGLDQASIIYEAIAEGGITRFMAIYGPKTPEKVGPVRSARTYYLDWALEYDAYYAHVGGNIDALDLIPQIGIKDLDQFRYGEKAYWRIAQAGKATEHTMYTNTKKLYDLAKGNKWDSNADFTYLKFKNELVLDQRPASQNITINFSADSYRVDWKYDREMNNYLRSLAGSPHKDAVSGQQLFAKNIIVQEVARESVITRINESGWKMTTIGSGKAKVFLDGKVIEATWKKTDRNSRTKFFDSDNKEIEFNPGVTWYEIVPPGTTLVVN